MDILKIFILQVFDGLRIIELVLLEESGGNLEWGQVVDLEVQWFQHENLKTTDLIPGYFLLKIASDFLNTEQAAAFYFLGDPQTYDPGQRKLFDRQKRMETANFVQKEHGLLENLWRKKRTELFG